MAVRILVYTVMYYAHYLSCFSWWPYAQTIFLVEKLAWPSLTLTQLLNLWGSLSREKNFNFHHPHKQVKFVKKTCSSICAWCNYLIVKILFSRCGPSQMIAPKFQELSLQYTSAVFLEVDVDACKVLTLFW